MTTRALVLTLLLAGCAEQTLPLDGEPADAGALDSGPPCDPPDPGGWGYVKGRIRDPIQVEGPATFTATTAPDEVALTFDSGEVFVLRADDPPPFALGARAFVALEVRVGGCPVSGCHDQRIAVWTLDEDGGRGPLALVRWITTDNFLDGAFEGLEYSLPHSAFAAPVEICGATYYDLDVLVFGRGVTTRVPPRCSVTTPAGLVVSNNLGRETEGVNDCRNDDSSLRSATGQIRDSTVEL